MNTEYSLMRPTALFFALALCATSISAQKTSGTGLLAFPSDPVAIATGEASATLSGNLGALQGNPAGLAWLPGVLLAASYNLHLDDMHDASLSVALPLARGGLALRLLTLQYGAIPNLVDGFSSGNLTPGSYAAQVAGALRLGAEGSALASLALGVSASVVYEVLASDYQGAGLSFDAGLLWKGLVGSLRGSAPAHDLDLALSVRQAGFGPAYAGWNVVGLPLSFVVGAAYQWKVTGEKGPVFVLRVPVDFLPVSENGLDLHYGIDLALQPVPGFKIALRAGAGLPQGGDLASTLRFGGGLDVGPFSLNYAYAHRSLLGADHILGLVVNLNKRAK